MTTPIQERRTTLEGFSRDGIISWIVVSCGFPLADEASYTREQLITKALELEYEVKCIGTDPVRCDNPKCPIHGGR